MDLAETDTCKITAWSEAVLSGYACGLSKRHVVERHELDDHEQASFLFDAIAVARAPAKLLSQDELRDPWQHHSSSALCTSSRECPEMSTSGIRIIAG